MVPWGVGIPGHHLCLISDHRWSLSVIIQQDGGESAPCERVREQVQTCLGPVGTVINGLEDAPVEGMPNVTGTPLPGPIPKIFIRAYLSDEWR
jgi:hypothetical protein